MHRKNSISSTEAQKTFCRICESLCGLEVYKEDGVITAIRPDDEHVATRGFACPKGLKQHKLFSSPDRLTHPMKKSTSGWTNITWDQALKDIGSKLKLIIDQHGPRSIGMYVGTAAGFGVLHPIFAQGFMDGLGSNNMFSSASQDCANKFAVAQLIYGHPFTQPFPDLLNTECLIITGANPVISKWSFLQVPNPSLHLKEMERRGCKIYVVDPRKTETAKVAGEHVPIRPNTDPFFFLSFLNEIIRQGGVRGDRIAQYARNADAVLRLADEWPPEKTASVTGIAASKISEMANSYLMAKGAAMYSSTGVNMGSHGSIAFWIQESINFLTGNLDRKGGTIVGRGVIDFPGFASSKGILLRKDRSRIGNFHSTNDAFPGGLLADEILTEGNGKIRALFVTGGNPLITMANSERLKKAFRSLELLVTLDIYPNETGVTGHFMLPCTSPLERPDLPFIFPLMLGMQTKPYLQATKAVTKPHAGQKDEATIYFLLARACGINLFGTRMAQWIMTLLYYLNRKKGIPQEFLLNALLRLCRQPSFKNLLRHESGKLRKPHQYGDFLDKRIFTSDGRIDLGPQMLIEQSALLPSFFEEEKSKLGRFKLITKRQVTTHNSWTHNIEEFTRGDRYTNFVYMHSKDAKRLGVDYKDLVDISTAIGTLRIPVKIIDDLMPGTVAVPHGWGHQDSMMKVAKKTQGVNVNILAADGLEHIEKVSGMSQLTGIDVHVEPSRNSRRHTWTGI